MKPNFIYQTETDGMDNLMLISWGRNDRQMGRVYTQIIRLQMDIYIYRQLYRYTYIVCTYEIGTVRAGCRPLPVNRQIISAYRQIDRYIEMDRYCTYEIGTVRADCRPLPLNRQIISAYRQIEIQRGIDSVPMRQELSELVAGPYQ